MPHDESGRPERPPIFDLRREVDFGPECHLLCILIPRDDAVEVLVNTAHGGLGLDHAAYHVYRTGVDEPSACFTDRPCSYPATAAEWPPT